MHSRGAFRPAPYGSGLRANYISVLTCLKIEDEQLVIGVAEANSLVG